jgi:hypothetical protein
MKLSHKTCDLEVSNNYKNSTGFEQLILILKEHCHEGEIRASSVNVWIIKDFELLVFKLTHSY